MSKESKKGGQFIISTEEMLLLSGANVAVFAAEVMHHHAIGIPGKCTISYFLLADSADLLFCNNTFNLLVENPLLLHPEEFGLQQTFQHLVAALPLSLLFQDALQENPDLTDLSVCWEQIDGLGGVELAVV